jgi:hypothetical protein
MAAPGNCEIVGKWRIVEADAWDQDYLDLVQPAYLHIGGGGSTEIAFGALTAGGECEYSRTTIFSRFNGFDEGDEISGELSAELRDDGTIEIEISFDSGDDAILTARRI